MIRRVKKQYPALQPLRRSFSTSLAYSLFICLVAVMLPLYESVNAWTLLLFILTALAALPHVLPTLSKENVATHPHRSYDRLLLALLLGSLSFIAYALYFFARSISGSGVDPTSQEHASATTLAYLTLYLGCVVSFYFTKKQVKSAAWSKIAGLTLFALLAYTALGQSIGFGPLQFIDLCIATGVTALYAGILYMVYHARNHTRHKLIADHDVATLAKHTTIR
ncbi:MAG: hypothetical protein WAS36_04350 [Candidatus Saccharimonadales bacterium]